MTTRSRFAAPPRIVVVTRPTELQLLLARHGTREQARFHLERRDVRIEEVEARHHQIEAVQASVAHAIPLSFRRARIDRSDLARFVFEPGDVIVVVGQDGLVANVAKYLVHGQPVIGVDPEPGRNAGVLVRHRAEHATELVRLASEGRVVREERTMVEVRLDDGQTLRALNEIFVGHRAHQSARYRIAAPGAEAEHQSSSGIVVTTGTGASGWARSITRERAGEHALPRPADPWVAFFVREAFPSPATGTSITEGRIETGVALSVRSEMGEGGVIFGDGMEEDRLSFGWGIGARVSVARERLSLVSGGAS